MRSGWPMLAVLLMMTVSRSGLAEHWNQFRGTGGNGVELSKVLPVAWAADDGDIDTNIAWKVTIPGVGWSQPIVWGDKIFLTTAETENQEKPSGGQRGPGFSLFSARGISRAFFGGSAPNVTYRWKVLCLNGKGETIWERLAHEGRPSIPIHRSNTYASETPVTDGERLIAYFGMTGVYCYDLSGNLLWSKELGSFPMQYGWGTGSSPVLFNELVFVQCDNEKASFLAALHKETGDEVWRVTREEDSNWSTPYVWVNHLRTELIVVGGNKVRSYDPHKGDLLWEMAASGRSATTPVSDERLLYVGSVTRNTGSGGELAAVRAGATGDISVENGDEANDFIAWSVPRAAPPIASPLLYQGCLYVLAQNGGVIRCFDAETGQQHYRQRLPRAVGFTASPWANDGKVFCLDEDGQTFVIQAGPELKVLHTNKLDEMFWSSAAVMGESLLLRGVDHLYRISK